MIKKFVKSLGVWNHAFLSLFMLPIIAVMYDYQDPDWYKAGFTVLLAYYFREITSENDKYNPFKWRKHNFIQSAILLIVVVIYATVLTAFLGGEQ